MIFQNIEFHNVEEMVPFEDGWKLHRAPAAVRDSCGEKLQDTSAYSTGVELRFCLRGDSATIRLRTLPIFEGQMACLYFGSIQGGFRQSTYVITERETVIRITPPENMAQLQEISREAGLPFSPAVVRLVLPYGNTIFLGVEGDVCPPAPEMLPRQTLLSYGSSITHGSLCLVMPYSYPFRIAQKLGMDSLNKGFAGTCLCESAMAQWLTSRRDWHVMTVELGVNMLGMEEAEFERRIDEFTAILAEDDRPIFATSIFSAAREAESSMRFRRIVEKYAAPRLRFTDGLALLNRPDFISQDGVHPSLEGIAQIADRWAEIISTGLNEAFHD